MRNFSGKFCSILFPILFGGFFQDIFSADLKYPCNEIKPELTKNANAVIRDLDENFTVTDKGHAVYKVHKVITILNKSGDDEAILNLTYDKIVKISDYKGIIYDSEGKQIRKIKTSEFSDVSLYNDGLFSDNRKISYRPIINTYPYTLDYSYSYNFEGILSYPDWDPQYEYDLSIEKSHFEINIPNTLSFRYKQFNVSDSVRLTHKGNTISYEWSLKDLPAVDYEPFSAGYFTPEVITAPDDFEIEGYQGDMRTWKSFGSFIYSLTQQENTLSDKTKSDLNKIVDQSADKKDLVKRVYEYMQSKTRYVNIKVGIGGWKAFNSFTVDTKGYGDCKALSNYTKALLKHVGIESIYTWANANNTKDILIDFPCNQYNHAILCVPLDNDTIWLECTDQLNPFGFMGSGTHNRHVLLITPEGGKLAFIPENKPEQNLQVRNAKVTFKDISSCNVDIFTKYCAIQYDNVFPIMVANADDQKKAMYNHVEIPNVNLVSWNFKEKKERIPEIDETIKAEINNYAVANGKRTFLPLNLMNQDHDVPKALKTRKSDILIRTGYTDIDTIQYQLPVGYKVEFLPEKKEINSEFGSYSAQVKSEGNTVTYIRKMLFRSGKFAATKYSNLVEFKKQVSNADNMKVSLVKE